MPPMARKGFRETDASLGGKRAALTNYRASAPGLEEEPQAGFQWQGSKTPDAGDEDLPEALARGLGV